MADRGEVIKGLNDIHAVACGLGDDQCFLNGIGVWQLQALIDAATELLKAQEDTRLVPRTPYHTKVAYKHSDEIVYWITDQCPECVERGELGIWDTLVDRYVKYCRRCGQALDWSEYDGRDQIDWDEYTSHVSERAERFLRRKGRYMSDG